jgi:hypothetical protein
MSGGLPQWLYDARPLSAADLILEGLLQHLMLVEPALQYRSHFVGAAPSRALATGVS